MFYAEKTSSNLFLFYSTYNENEQNSKIEEEEEVINNCDESTILEQSFYALLSGYKGEG